MIIFHNTGILVNHITSPNLSHSHTIVFQPHRDPQFLSPSLPGVQDLFLPILSPPSSFPSSSRLRSLSCLDPTGNHSGPALASILCHPALGHAQPQTLLWIMVPLGPTAPPWSGWETSVAETQLLLLSFLQLRWTLSPPNAQVSSRFL